MSTCQCKLANSFPSEANQAGKTNLFKIMGLLAAPSGGCVRLFGKNVESLKDGEKADLRLNRLGLFFQFFNLLPSLSVLENIELPMALAGLKKVTEKLGV
jgi:putative ABC transport system ATP-binding protein